MLHHNYAFHAKVDKLNHSLWYTLATNTNSMKSKHSFNSHSKLEIGLITFSNFLMTDSALTLVTVLSSDLLITINHANSVTLNIVVSSLYLVNFILIYKLLWAHKLFLPLLGDLHGIVWWIETAA